ncbi:DNA /pantothenate metabolism flavoprotein [Helicobacter mustelae]|uniref:bifunctional phosphopantothenoylcysteine decarboxylase/phosphopantothenate--cysteine ligase CoaBC n=1 Tax=Helicobacter mustelae TaxID=217 RepID=UPI000E0462D1|nr:bifunctional phosphopantothenoylcysteine decarboxylase/phosphopantothenate--cysteine ligase CoaBC [Helicobacter mustelae]STP13190.1 DNA /pantothenate metabolism flavoprotein [Helicobacter mustelae]
MQFHEIFAGKKILICASASIAIYKILDLISTLKKSQASIKVTLTPDAQKFLTPLCFEALTHTTVLCENSESWDSQCNHIAYAKWADIILIAPASANTIAKIASGIADNVLLATILASPAKKLIAPAMNTQMLDAKQTQDNLAKLQASGYTIIPTRTSLLACDTHGDGALAENFEILSHLARAFCTSSPLGKFWQGKRVIITGGGSKEAIDSVRCISNHSSGLQASALCLGLFFYGAEVHFISSAFPTPLPQGIFCIEAQSAKEYHQALQELTKSHQESFLFMAAAIADFKPKNPVPGKIKKQDKEELWIACEKNLDILQNLQSPNLIKIGFKAESDPSSALDSAKKMLIEKQCLCVCLNILSHQNSFGALHNEMTLINSHVTKTIPLNSKFHIADKILEFVAQTLQTHP